MDNRYTPPEGRYHYDQPKTVDTTYVIRKPFGHTGNIINRPNSKYVAEPAYLNFPRKIPISLPIPSPIHSNAYKILPASDFLFSGFYDPAWNHPHAFQWSGSGLGHEFHHDQTSSLFDASQVHHLLQTIKKIVSKLNHFN